MPSFFSPQIATQAAVPSLQRNILVYLLGETKMPSQASNFTPLPKKSWGLHPKNTGTETSEIQTTKIKENIRHNWNLQHKKPIRLLLYRGIFRALSQIFFFGHKKNIAHHGTTVLACRQPQSAHNAASAMCYKVEDTDNRACR